MVRTAETVAIGDVEQAERRIEGLVRHTPLLPAGELSRRVGAEVVLKAENLQRTGSFKPRGALNMALQLPPARLAAGLCAGSAGNHAQALAYAAEELGTSAVVYMPEEAPLAKVAAARRHGAEVRQTGASFAEAQEAAEAAAAESGMTVVPAFDHPQVVAGQGTVGLEIARDAPSVRLVVVPLGGGGLAAGTAIAVKARLPEARVVGVQAEGCAPYLDSLAAHRPIGARSANTICDGIAVKRPGELTLPLVERWLDEVVTVSDDDAAQAMVLLLERSKQVVEGAGAVAVAALMGGKVEPPATGSACAILSGGNVDASLLAECIRLGETAAGRRMVLATVVPDRPGALAHLLRVVADHGANVIDVEHVREGVDLHLREAAIQLVLQTGGPERSAEIERAVRDEGFEVRVPGRAPVPGERPT
jgi:threonine dehydratase